MPRISHALCVADHALDWPLYGVAPFRVYMHHLKLDYLQLTNKHELPDIIHSK